MVQFAVIRKSFFAFVILTFISIAFYTVVLVHDINVFDRLLLSHSEQIQCKDDFFVKGNVKYYDGEHGGDHWQVVAAHQTYVFSAHLDHRVGPHKALRIIGITSTHNFIPFFQSFPNYFCQLWFSSPENDSFTSTTVKLQTNFIRETHKRKFAAILYTCLLLDNRVPIHVSVKKTRCGPASNVLWIHDSPFMQDESERLKDSFTVCVAPLHSNYSNVYQLVEFIESNRLFGADHFVFYSHSIGSDLVPYLEHYLEEGVVDLIQWSSLPMTSCEDGLEITPEVHYFGQVAAQNDCLYRNMFTSKYLTFLDVDEIIVPKTASTWEELLKGLTERYQPVSLSIISFRYPQKIGAFSFRNRFFSTVLERTGPYANHTIVETYHIKSVSHVHGDNILWPHYYRSKYITIPTAMEVAGIHFAHKFFGEGVGVLEVPAHEALLQHYRTYGKGNVIIEDAILKFAPQIMKHICSRHEKIRHNKSSW